MGLACPSGDACPGVASIWPILRYNTGWRHPGFTAVQQKCGARRRGLAAGGDRALGFVAQCSPSSTRLPTRTVIHHSSDEGGDGQPLQEDVAIAAFRRMRDRHVHIDARIGPRPGGHPVDGEVAGSGGGAWTCPKAATGWNAKRVTGAAPAACDLAAEKKPCTQGGARTQGSTRSPFPFPASTPGLCPTGLNQPWTGPRLPRHSLRHHAEGDQHDPPGFFVNERCFWHSGGNYSFSGAGGRADAAADRGRFAGKPGDQAPVSGNLVEVTGLDGGAATPPEPSTEEDLLASTRRAMSTTFRQDRPRAGASWGCARPSAPDGFALRVAFGGVDQGGADRRCCKGGLDNALCPCRGRQGITCLPDFQTGFSACLNKHRHRRLSAAAGRRG